MNLVAFHHRHVQFLDIQHGALDFTNIVDDEFLEMAGLSQAYTGLVNGRPVFCYGLYELWKGRAIAWALMDKTVKQHAKSVHRSALWVLNNSGLRRIEATVDPGYPMAIRWLEHLGFKYECTFKAYTPAGDDMLSYVRLK